MIDTLLIRDCIPPFCVRGVRAMCGLLAIDFRQFVRVGYPISELEGITDPTIQLAIKKAKKRIAAHGR